MSAAFDKAMMVRKQIIGKLESISMDGKLIYFRFTETLNFSLVTQTYEIFSGSMYLSQPGGWNSSKKTYVRFEARLYPPYRELAMSIEPVDSSWRSKCLLTTVDFKVEPKQLEWVKQSICRFYLEAIRADDLKINDSQQELPY